jgi:hypothetical protein
MASPELEAEAAAAESAAGAAEAADDAAVTMESAHATNPAGQPGSVLHAAASGYGGYGDGWFWAKVMAVEKLGKAGRLVYTALQGELSDDGSSALDADPTDMDAATKELRQLFESLESFEVICAKLRQQTSGGAALEELLCRRASAAAELVAPLTAAVAAYKPTLGSLEERLQRIDERLELVQANDLTSQPPAVAAMAATRGGGAAAAELRKVAEAALRAFATHFNAEGAEDTSALGGEATGRIGQLKALTEQHSAMFAEMLAGRSFDAEKAVERTKAQERLMEELVLHLDHGVRAYEEMMRAATALLAAQRRRHFGGESPSALTESGMLAIEGLRILDHGLQYTVQGARSLAALLEKRTEHVRDLPTKVEEAARLKALIKKANKSAQRLRTKITSALNRRQELLEYGDISDGEHDDVSDDEFQGHTVEGVTERLEKLRERTAGQLAKAAEGREALTELMQSWLPELKFEALLLMAQAGAGDGGGGTIRLAADADMTRDDLQTPSALSAGTTSAVDSDSGGSLFLAPAPGSAYTTSLGGLSPIQKGAPPTASPIGVRYAPTGALGIPPSGYGVVASRTSSTISVAARTTSPTKADIVAQRMTLEAHRAKLEEQLAEIKSKF